MPHSSVCFRRGRCAPHNEVHTRRHARSAAWSLFAACLPLVLTVPCQAATRVELQIDELRANRTVPWPITTGVPFPQGGLKDERHCRLVDDLGREQPLQAKAAATWDAARSSIRWLTIDFIAEPGRKYALEFGPDNQRREFPAAISIADKDDVVVRTGPLEVEFSRRGPAALGSVRIDRNGDGQITPEERIASGPTGGDHVFLDQNDATSSGARDDADRTIVVESTGPVRACVRVEGWYTGPKGERIVGYRTRYHLFAGLPLVKMIDEFRIVGSTRDVRFRDIALPLDLHVDATSRSYAAAVGPPDAAATLAGNDAPGGVSLVQEVYRHYGNPECRGYLEARTPVGAKRLREGERVGPWLQVADRRAAVTASLRWFWQQFPKEWSVAGDRLALHLWSPHAAPLDFGEAGLREFFGPAGENYLVNWKAAGTSNPISDFFYYAGRHALNRDGANGLGINKHHEVWYHFGRADEAPQGREYGDLADRQPLCLATGEWNVGTGVFGPLAARPNDSPYEAIVDRIFDLERYAQDAFGDYGWWLFGAGPHYSYQWDAEANRHYADPRRFEYHTYQRETQLWWCYLRSGERKFYDWAIPSENHWVDIAVAHVPTKYSTEWRGGSRGEATLHYPRGDWSIDSPLHYVRHHDTGEAWLRSASQYWATYHRTLETTTLAYYLTGDERYNDVVNFWRDYWGPLAGVRSNAAGVPPWHTEQMWWQPTAQGKPTKSWAEMLRDYAPFQSGSRHQQTLFFNLSTLYEHTWDPTLGQVLREYAAAFLDPEAPNGVWQCQDHRLPANSDSPMLAHYWSPALWKYARATADPRMPEILKKYFTACYDADPYGEDVGVYSNVQIAWAWHFTRDPRHLVAARRELDKLLPNAEPLAKPEDLGSRIYNPYEPIRCLTAVPRLIGALAEAQSAGIDLPPSPPLNPQRTLIAIRRKSGERFGAVLWGWDAEPKLLDERGAEVGQLDRLISNRSPRTPFDRVLPNYLAFRRDAVVPKSDSNSWCFLSPRVETGLLELSGADDVWCWAGEPVSIEPRQPWTWRRATSARELILESAQATQLFVSHNGRNLSGKPVKNTLVFSLDDIPANALLTIENHSTQPVWFRLNDVADRELWVAPTATPGKTPPLPDKVLAARKRPDVDEKQTFIPGKFGRGLLLVPGRELHIPDEVTEADGTLRRLSNQRQGTIEFWVRRMWDDRLAPVSRPLLLSAGSLSVSAQREMPLDEWCHVAVAWHPIPGDAERSLAHVYVDGRDYAFYRSLYWEGYAKPPIFSTAQVWLKEFVAKASPGAMFAIDDLRISTAPRYVDVSLDFGRQQTFNPNAFTPPTRPAERDDSTVLLFPFDGDVRGTTVAGRTIEARLVQPSAK